MSWLKYSSAAPFDPLAEKHPLLDNEGEGEEGGREGSRGIVITFTHTHTHKYFLARKLCSRLS